MKKVWLLSAAVLMLTACGARKSDGQATETADREAEQCVGGQKDEHGCLPAAGETWSELRGTCLQVFNEGIRLNPIEVKEGEAVISAFVLFNDDRTKAEIFFPADRPNVILDKSTDGVYRKEDCCYDDRTGVLSIGGKDVYKAEDTLSETLIIFYDEKTGNEPLMKAVEEYGAKLVYRYEQMKGIAVVVAKEKTEQAIAYFEKVKGVLGVNKNEINQLHGQ